jgi:hypothetical protein
METEKNKLTTETNYNNNSDSDSESDSSESGEISQSIATVGENHPASPSSSRKKEEDVVVLNLKEASDLLKGFEAREDSHRKLLEEGEKKLDVIKACALKSTEKINEKPFKQNLKQLRAYYREETKLHGIISSTIREEKLEKIEEALHSPTIMPIELKDAVSAQIGVLYSAWKKKLLTDKEFEMMVLIRIKQVPDALRWQEVNGILLDRRLMTDFGSLQTFASDLHESLEDNNEKFVVARQLFIKRVKGIDEEKNRKLDGKLDSLLQAYSRVPATPTAPLSMPGNSKTDKTMEQRLEEIKARPSACVLKPLFPEEIKVLEKIIGPSYLFSLEQGASLQSLVDAHQKKLQRISKKTLAPDEHLKPLLRLQNVVNEKAHEALNHIRQGTPGQVQHIKQAAFDEAKRINKEDDKAIAQTDSVVNFQQSGDPLKDFFSHYSQHLADKIKSVDENLKWHTGWKYRKQTPLWEEEKNKYIFMQKRAKELKKIALTTEKEKTILLFPDVSLVRHGMSEAVKNQFKQVEGKSSEELLQLKTEIGKNSLFHKNKDYQVIEQQHEKERCLSGDQWKPLSQALASYVDEQLNLSDNKPEITATSKLQSLSDALEAGTAKAEAEARDYRANTTSFFPLPIEKDKNSHTKKTSISKNKVACLIA